MGNVSSCCIKDPERQQSERNVKEFIQQLKPQLENSSSNQIENLVNFIEKQIEFIQAQDSDRNSVVTDVAQSVTSSIDIASQILDKVSTELDKFQNTTLAKAMGDLTLQVVKVVGQAHWAMLGLSMVALTLQRWMVYKSMENELIGTLTSMVYLAKNVKTLWESMDKDRRKQLQDAVQVIVEGVLICDAHLSQRNSFLRYLSAATVVDQLQEIQKKIEQHNLFLVATVSTEAMVYLKKNIAEISEAKWPEKPNDFVAVGIDNRVEEVKKLLKMKDKDPVAAVALCGFGGVGKTHLAQSVIYSLKEDKEVSSKFKYCRVDAKKGGGTVDSSDITKLQQSIISSLEGKSENVRSPDEGKHTISNIIKGKYCFIFINNLHEKNFVKHLLPELLDATSSGADDTRVRILITCREGHFGTVMGANCEVFDVKTLDLEASKEILLWRITRDKKELKFDFHESELIIQVAQECKGVPLLLNLFGDHLCDWRTEKGKDAYENVLGVLRDGNIEGFADETLSNTLIFVFDHLKNPEWKEALLDICVYYYGWDWMRVSCILTDIILTKLQEKSLLVKDDSGNIIVHDIILKMAKAKAKGNRIKEKEFLSIRASMPDLQNVKGLVLSGTSFIRLEAAELQAMSSSLRYLNIRSCVSISQPCLKEFKELRFLTLGDLDEAPFKNSTQLPKLKGFHLAALDIMERTVSQILQCRDLKFITVDPSHLDSCFLQTGPDVWTKVRKLHLQIFRRLSPYITCHQSLDTNFQDDIKWLSLHKFQRVPEIDNLKNMTKLSLKGCKIEALPRVTSVLPALKILNLRWCTKLKSLHISNFPRLEHLDLEGCIKLEELSEDMQKLQALTFLDLSRCINLKRLPETFGKLSALNNLKLTECIRLEELPDSFADLPLTSLKLKRLDSLKSLPSTIGNMKSLENMAIVSCKSIETLPDGFVLLKKLKMLSINKCSSLTSLPMNFNNLSSLEGLELSFCGSLNELPPSFETLPALKYLKIESCKNMSVLPDSFSGLVSLDVIFLSDLPIKRLPVFGPLNKLKSLLVIACKELEGFPKDMVLDFTVRISLIYCLSLPGAVLDWILQCPRCLEINIQDSLHLKQRWELVKNNTDSTSLVIESNEPVYDVLQHNEWQRAATTALLNGGCVEHSADGKIISRDSLPIENCNSVALLCISDVFDATHFPFLNSEDGRMLTVFFKGFAENETEEDIAKMDESILKYMEKCPTSAVAIRSGEIKRRMCLEHLFFTLWRKIDLVANGAVCTVTHLESDENGVWKFVNPDKDKEIIENIKKLLEPFGGEDFLNESSESEDDLLSREMLSLGKWIEEKKIYNIEKYRSKYASDKAFVVEAMKENMHTLVNKHGNKAEIQDIISSDEEFCIYESPLNMWNLILLRHLSEKLNVKMVWIVRFNKMEMEKDVKLGSGTYTRMIKNMPDRCWAVLQPIEPFVTMFGNILIFQATTLHYVDDKGEASPDFVKTAQFLDFNVGAGDISSESNLVNQTQTIVSSHRSTKPLWRFLFGDKNFNDMLEGKLVFVFANPLEPFLNEWQEKLEQLWQGTHQDHNFDVVHIGYPRRKHSVGEHVTYQMHIDTMSAMPWKFLSYTDMVLLWWRILNSEFETVITLPGLVLLEDGIVITRNAQYVITMLMKEAPTKEENSEEAVIKQELLQSLKNGQCSAFVKTFFVDCTDHPMHPQHNLWSCPFGNETSTEGMCVVCGRLVDIIEDKVFACRPCGFFLCEACWKPYLFAKAMEAKENEAKAGVQPLM